MTNQELGNAMETHGGTVYRLALCRLRNAADAEDVYQDVFLRLFGQDTADWTAERMKAWLIRATLNRCADLYRFRLRRDTLPLEEVAAAVPDPETPVLWEAVGQLPERLRIPIHLHYGEGYSTEEIAAILSVPAATVRTRLHRARGKLRAILGGIDDEAKL